ncbi:glycine receptor subunit alpha-2-like [Mytilus edulis]|uniref:glycine receptor subunit alpha-2-like n=1 Tax=Mytilus edulis TaxID=6550 RepID=UPI0039F0BBAA
MTRKNHRFLVLGLVVTFICFPSETEGENIAKTFLNHDVHAFVLKEIGKVPPAPENGSAIIVDCELNIDSFDSINEANMDFTVGIFLHLYWHDERYIQWIMKSSSHKVSFDHKSMEKLWLPDIYFPNEKEARLHSVFVPNKMLSANLGGNVSYTARVSLKLNCPMQLKNYPFDRQTCSIEMESFSLSEKSLKLRWMATGEHRPVVKNEDVELPQFTITNVNIRNESRTRRDKSGHSCLIADIILERRIKYYIVQMYIPSMFVVFLSWMSFWLNVGAVPGRISLGVLTVLTMVTQSSGVNASLPRVSYTKAIDVWMSTCLLFVFAALIEFAVANVLSRRDLNRGFRLKDIPILPRISTKKKKTKSAEVVIGENGEMKLNPATDPTLSRSMNRTPGHIQAMYLDVASRFFFPFLFAMFNVFYWTHYL